ncbi:uncharacterized protein Fot_33575 [Forsythia ovata]|uniref:Uncharacterized protein n=1 Tax=Forsythia ovata TaxID=205694 RepID=A0ABD1TBK0_9LAMI
MAISRSPEFEIKHNDDKYFSSLVSKETSKIINPSFRVYYGDVSGTVPFMWETRPGTPKHHTFCDSDTTIIPPLTPPPSYYSTNINKPLKTSSKSRLIHTLLRRINLKKVPQFEMPSSVSSLSCSTSSHLSLSDTMTPSYVYGGGRQFSGRGTLFADDHKKVCPSRLCLIMKEALLSIVGRGSGYGNS